MKKKSLLIVLSLLLVAVCIATLVACNRNGATDNNQSHDEWGTVYTMEAAYAKAADLGYAGTLDEFIALISGKDGADGRDGIDGVDGKDGQDGKDGIDGTNGKDGQNGKDGVDGKDGIDGVDGKDGQDGKDGIDGADGKDGVGIVGIELNSSGNLIIRLTNNTSVNLGQVFKCAHTYSAWSVVLQPTCTSLGCDVRTCTKCNGKEYRFSAELGHVWDDGEYFAEPNCVQKGLKVYTCIECNATKSEVLDKKHDYVDGTCSVCGKLEPTEDSLMFSLINDGTAYRVQAIHRDITNVVIPETYNGLPVTHISSGGFASCDKLESIFIPSSIIYIESTAFSNCENLKSLHIPKSVTAIGVNIAALNNLERITVEDGNPVYHSYGNCLIETESKTLLFGCKNSFLPTDGSIIRIEQFAFLCTELTSIVIPESIVEIGSHSFDGCSSLKVVYNLSNLNIRRGTSAHGFVAYYAEELYTSLPTVDDALTLTLTSKGDGYKVVTTDKSITSIEIPAIYNGLPVKEIGDDGFANCTELESVSIPNSVTRIGRYAFMHCTNLQNITIPNSVTSIGNNAFSINSLESITVEDGNPVYHSTGNCLIETESKTLVFGCKNSVIPRDGSVEKIGKYAFFKNEITTIIIPESIIEIDNYAFLQCFDLKVVYNLSDLDIEIGSTNHGRVAYYAEELYTSLDDQTTEEETI